MSDKSIPINWNKLQLLGISYEQYNVNKYMGDLRLKIDMILLEKRIKKKDFLNLLDMSVSSYYDAIKKNNISVELIIKIADVLKVPVSYFVENSNIKEEITESDNIIENIINSLQRQNEQMTHQISDLIKMQLINAETIKNLTSK